jgi:hypothetical protein
MSIASNHIMYKAKGVMWCQEYNFVKAHFLNVLGDTTEVVIIQATVPITWLCAMEESLGVSSYSVTIPFYLLAFFPAVARIKHTSYVVPD